MDALLKAEKGAGDQAYDEDHADDDEGSHQDQDQEPVVLIPGKIEMWKCFQLRGSQKSNVYESQVFVKVGKTGVQFMANKQFRMDKKIGNISLR